MSQIGKYFENLLFELEHIFQAKPFSRPGFL